MWERLVAIVAAFTVTVSFVPATAADEAADTTPYVGPWCEPGHFLDAPVLLVASYGVGVASGPCPEDSLRYTQYTGVLYNGFVPDPDPDCVNDTVSEYSNGQITAEEAAARLAGCTSVVD